MVWGLDLQGFHVCVCVFVTGQMKGPMRVCESRSIVILDNTLSGAVRFSWFLVASPLVNLPAIRMVDCCFKSLRLLVLLAEKNIQSIILYDHFKIIFYI